MLRDPNQETKTAIGRLVNLKDKNILEVGCGNGRVTAMLPGPPKRIVAVDPDERRIARAEETVSGVEFKIASGECLPFADEMFDVVLFTLSLHHHEDCNKALAEAGRVLKDEGALIIMEPALDGEVQQLFNLFDDETPALVSAWEVMEKWDFQCKGHDVFYNDWVFENKDELYNYDFTVGEEKINESDLKQIDEMLGEKINSQPIVLKDKIRMVSLRKRIRG